MSSTESKAKKVKDIFEDMDYENITENVDLAMAWLSQHNHQFCMNGKSEDDDEFKLFLKEDVRVVVGMYNDEYFDELFKKSEFESKAWLNIPALEKAKLLHRLAAEIERHATLFCQLEVICSNILSKSKSYRSIVDNLRYYAGWACLIDTQFPDYKPYGVCGCNLGNTSSLAVLGTFLAPALAAGNVVIIGAEAKFAPVAALIIELCKNVGFPDGSVIYCGATYLMTMLSNESIKKVAFADQLCSQLMLETVVTPRKYLTTLSVGRSGMVVFDNADLDSACDMIVESAWICDSTFPWGLEKIFVQESIFKEFLKRLRSKMKKLNVGYEATEKTLDIVIPRKIPYLTAESEMINKLPLIIGNKIFGKGMLSIEEPTLPVSLIPFRTANEAAGLVNNSRFGFATSIWTENVSLANEMTSKLKCGLIWINTHKYMSPNAPFSPYKYSGRGHFGGKEGLMEYLTYNKSIEFNSVNLKTTEVKLHLPSPIKKKRTFLFYSGTFKKSETSLTEADTEFPNRKDVRNCVEGAKKGYESWNKLSAKVRSQNLWKLAENSASIKANPVITNRWLKYLYEWSTLCNSTESLVQQGTPALRVIKESLGVVAIELHSDANYSCLKLIVAALAYGNAVIVLDFSEDMHEFLVELCKVVSTSGFIAGTFNVFFNLNHEVVEKLQMHRELEVYFRLNNKLDNSCFDFETRAKYYDNVNFNSNYDILNLVTKNKCVWTNAGESFL